MENSYILEILKETPNEVMLRVKANGGFNEIFEAIDDSDGLILLKDGHRISHETPIGKFLFQFTSEYFEQQKKDSN